MEIYNKLEKARELVRTTKHKKSGRNEYSKYDYFTPEQVELIVSEVTKETRLLPICNLRRNEFGLFQEMILINLEKPEECLFFELATIQGEMKATNDTQQMGGTDTYSERYLKMKVFQIKDNNIDPDSKDNRKIEEPKKVARKESDFQKALRVITTTGEMSKLTEFESKIPESVKYTKEEKETLLGAILSQMQAIQC